MDEQELIKQKLDLTRMQLEATTDAKSILEMVKNTLDTETILFSVQVQALNKIGDIIFSQNAQLEDLLETNSKLKANNAVLAGVAVEEQPVLTDEELEYDKIMNMEND